MKIKNTMKTLPFQQNHDKDRLSSQGEPILAVIEGTWGSGPRNKGCFAKWEMNIIGMTTLRRKPIRSDYIMWSCAVSNKNSFSKTEDSDLRKMTSKSLEFSPMKSKYNVVCYGMGFCRQIS
jgi:hypothetical protein